MNDDGLRQRLQSIDPMPEDHTIESATGDRARRRLEGIMSTPIIDETDGAEVSRRRRSPWYAAAAVAAAVVAVIAVGAIVVNRAGDDAPVASGTVDLVAEPFNPATSCIVPSAEVLAQTELAFAGTVTAIDGETISLTVDRWYTDEEAGTVVVTAVAGLEALTGSVPWAEGERFLVSATNGVVAYCGLSGAATPELEAMYDEAFPG